MKTLVQKFDELIESEYGGDGCNACRDKYQHMVNEFRTHLALIDTDPVYDLREAVKALPHAERYLRLMEWISHCIRQFQELVRTDAELNFAKVNEIEPGQINFVIEDEEILSIRKDGIYLRGRLITKDTEVVEGLRDFVQRLTGRKKPSCICGCHEETK